MGAAELLSGGPFHRRSDKGRFAQQEAHECLACLFQDMRHVYRVRFYRTLLRSSVIFSNYRLIFCSGNPRCLNHFERHILSDDRAKGRNKEKWQYLLKLIFPFFKKQHFHSNGYKEHVHSDWELPLRFALGSVISMNSETLVLKWSIEYYFLIKILSYNPMGCKCIPCSPLYPLQGAHKWKLEKYSAKK